MSKGNPELRFRATPELHSQLERLQDELGLAEKVTGAKLLISLGDDKLNEVVDYIDGITHPLTEPQFEDLFSSIKIRVKQRRQARRHRKKQKSV
tara:strand:- start:96 stop:377 length:282 start_codon:yes stop_codon:yes gene_type:complete